MDFGFDDDPRGFKKKKSAFQKFQVIWGKLSWVVLAVLLLLFWRLTHHHKSLKAETQQHIEEKDRYLDQIGHLDSHVHVKSQEVKTLERLHDQMSQNADHHQNRAQQLEAEHQRLEAERLHEAGEFKKKLQTVQTELDNCHKSLEGERHIVDTLHNELDKVKSDRSAIDATSALQAEVDKLKIQLEYATQLAKGAAAGAIKDAPGGRLEEQAKRQAQDDAVADSSLKKASKAADDARAQAQQGRRPDGVQRGGGPPNSDDSPLPPKQAQPAHQEEEAPQQQQQQNEEAQNVRSPSAFRRRRSTKRRGGLSMLEEHLGIEHDEGEVADEQRGEGQERVADQHVPIGRIPHHRR